MKRVIVPSSPNIWTRELSYFGCVACSPTKPRIQTTPIGMMMASSQDVLVGDLVASGILIGGIALTQRAIRPPFEDNPQTVALELARMVKEGHKRFYMGHGGPLEAPEVMRHAQTLSKMTQDPCVAGDCNHQFH